jgi:hypothetical protein
VSNIGNTGGIEMCLVSKVGFSTGCAFCFAAQGDCGSKLCENQCINGVPTAACLACLAMNCDAMFTACSGIPFPG